MNSINSEDKPVDQNGRPYNRLLLVFTLLIGTFSTFLTSTMLTTAFPTLMKSFSISANTVQWLTTGFMLMMGIVIPITGFFLQRFDSRKLYLSAIVIFFVGTIVCYFAQNFWTILAGRLIEAAGVGITSPVYQTIMTSIFPPAKRGAAMGSAGIVVGLAPCNWANVCWLDFNSLFVANAIFSNHTDLSNCVNYWLFHTKKGITH